jgi:hypothetical protein
LARYTLASLTAALDDGRQVASGERRPWSSIDGTADARVRHTDLSGHFWARIAPDDHSHTWTVSIFDYESNTMATAAGVSEAIAQQIVEAWDHEVRRAAEDPRPIAFDADDA